ncbi:MAG: serine/threonine protein kinase [Deltaproteobacteria bacterium]|nr:serine/threonine protein kinase [Deltaproteobacteria bacterium]
MSALARGAVLGERFTLIGELGRGGMATVWLAEDRVRGARVALKILHAHLVGDASTRERLRREVMTAGLIKHEGALLAQELHELDGHLALSMPYHPGRTLSERVAAEGPIGGTALRAIGARLADVLAAAHRAGVLHRDITPANVMIDDAGVATLTDFGLARLEQWQSTRHTGALGTAGHAAPEVYDGERADPRSDLYSLGTVLYYAASGPGALRRAQRRRRAQTPALRRGRAPRQPAPGAAGRPLRHHPRALAPLPRRAPPRRR